MSRAPEPGAGDERELLLGWLGYHRDALEAKCDGVSHDDLVRTGLGGSSMSLLGLVRHLTEMEHAYFRHALGGVDRRADGELDMVYGPYEEGRPEGDFDDLTPAMVDPSFETWRQVRDEADRLIAALPSCDAVAPDRAWTLRRAVLKVLQEYARHNGHADLIRQSIDGATGE